MAIFSNRAFISCSINRTCWGATSVDKTPMKLPFSEELQLYSLKKQKYFFSNGYTEVLLKGEK